MKTIQEIEELLSINNEMLKRYEANLIASPDSISNQVQVENVKQHISDLNTQLNSLRANIIQEKKDRLVEIIELRLIGKQARNGTLPLDILGKIALAFSDSIYYTSRKIQFGDKKGSLQEIKQTLDLRLAKVATGSTRIFITGQTNPDLFGRSLIEDSLNGTFKLLSAEDDDQLIDAASFCGYSGTDKLKTFLSSLSFHDLELEMNWDSAHTPVKRWDGKKQRLLEISNSLRRINKSIPKEIPFEGVLISSSLKGNFELKLSDKRKIKGHFPHSIFDQVKQVTIGDDCKGILEETCITNLTSSNEKYTYSLKEIEAVE